MYLILPFFIMASIYSFIRDYLLFLSIYYNIYLLLWSLILIFQLGRQLRALLILFAMLPSSFKSSFVYPLVTVTVSKSPMTPSLLRPKTLPVRKKHVRSLKGQECIGCFQNPASDINQNNATVETIVYTVQFTYLLSMFLYCLLSHL